MNKKLLAALFLLCLATSISGCGDEKSVSATNAAEKKLTVAIYRDGAMGVLDAASYNGPHFLFKMIYEGFAEDGGEGALLPRLATGWEIAGNGRTYTFHLRKDVQFSDGAPLNAEAVSRNLKRWANQGKYVAVTASRMERVETPDEHTVRVTYKDAAYPILTELTYPRPVRFLSPASLTPEGGFSKPLGSGPWMFDTYEKDKEFSLVPNPRYWGEKPRLDRIVFKFVPDGQARVLALQSGEVDIIGGDLVGKIPMNSFVELQKDSNFKTFMKGTLCSHFIAFNQNVEAFRDKRVRLAMNYAVDKKSIARDLFDGIGLEAVGLFQKGVPYATPENNYSAGHDKEKARELLREAGYVDTDGDGILEKDGRKLEFAFLLTADEFPEWKPLAEFIQAELSAVGVKTNLTILDRNGYTQATMETKRFDLALMRTASDSWMPHGAMLELFAPLAGNDQAKAWYDDGLHAWILRTLRTIDTGERQKGYDTVMGYISEEALTIPVYHPVSTFAVNAAKVAGFAIGVNNYAPVEWEKLDIASPAK